MPDTTEQPRYVIPEPTVIKRTKTREYKVPGDTTSWNPSYAPPKEQLNDRIKSFYTNRGRDRGATAGTLIGMAGGALAGGVGGALLGGIGQRSGFYRRDSQLMGGVMGGTLGGVVGAGIGSHFGGKRGWKKGQARGEKIVGMISGQAGPVSHLQAAEPKEAKRWFAKQGNLETHKATPYHKDYKYKTHTTTSRVVFNEPNGKPEILTTTGVDKGERRNTAPVKTGYAKHGYYRENIMTDRERAEILEFLVEAEIYEGRVSDAAGKLKDFVVAGAKGKGIGTAATRMWNRRGMKGRVGKRYMLNQLKAMGKAGGRSAAVYGTGAAALVGGGAAARALYKKRQARKAEKAEKE